MHTATTCKRNQYIKDKLYMFSYNQERINPMDEALVNVRFENNQM